jgi:MGT family glycosyltransferase
MKNLLKQFAGVDLPYLKAGTRILFANAPADGHFNPLTALAVHLRNEGCEVRWYSSSHYADKIKRLGIPLYPFKRALDWTGDKIDEYFPERTKIHNKIKKVRFDIIHAFILRSTEYYEDICEIYESFPFDVFIADNCFSAIPFVKDKIGVPVIAIGVLPLTETSKDLAPTGLGMTPAKSFAGRRKQDFLRWLSDKVLFRKPTELMQQLLEQHGIAAPDCNVFDLISRKSDLLLQSGTPSFEYKRSDLSSNVRFIGPLLPWSEKKQSKLWSDNRLQRYKKVILVTQGTVEKDTTKLLVPVLEALKNTEYLVVVTTGGSDTVQLQAKYLYDNIIIEDFIPFHQVMPMAHAYITNGGYGGVMLAIKHQLPIIAAGIHEGKNEINARIGYFKLGVNLGTERPTPSQIRKSVAKIMKDETYKENAIRLSWEFAAYDPLALCASYVASVLEPARENRMVHIPRSQPVTT